MNASVALLWRLVRPHGWLVVASAASMCVGAVCTVGYALIAGPALAFVAGQNSALPLTMLAVGLVLLSATRGAAFAIQQRCTGQLTESVVSMLRQELFRHVLMLSPRVLAEQRAGDLAARLTVDVAQMRHLVGVSLVGLVRDGLTISGLGALLLGLQPWLALWVLVSLPLIAFIVPLFAGRIRRAYRGAGDIQGRLASTIADIVPMIPVVRSYQAQETQRTRFSEHAQQLKQRNLQVIRLTSTMSPLIEILCALSVAMALVLVGVVIPTSTMPTATLVSFFAAAFLIYRPLLRLASVVQQTASGLAALDRLQELLHMPVEDEAPASISALSEGGQGLAVRNLSAGYGPTPIIRAVSFALREGEALAVVGRTGAGKSTLLAALLGNLQDSNGSITWGGLSQQALGKSAWRSRFAWLPQSPQLLTGTVTDNIALGAEAVNPERLNAVSQACGALTMINSLPEKFSTILGESGVSLSVGEAQRLCIARALYKQASVLLLDEPTSALDGPTENDLKRTLEAYRQEHPKVAVVIVSHRLSTVLMADQVLVLDQGKLVESGTPRELWRRKGEFFRLFSEQLPSEFLQAGGQQS